MLPETPTFAEEGIPELDLRIWTGILAPHGTPDSIIAVLNRAIHTALARPDVQAIIVTQGGTIGRTSPAEFATFVDSERVRWSRLVAESGIPRVEGPL
jgi:tripartite-type tricarboxylate transporter receptor subunit TctC